MANVTKSTPEGINETHPNPVQQFTAVQLYIRGSVPVDIKLNQVYVDWGDGQGNWCTVSASCGSLLANTPFHAYWFSGLKVLRFTILHDGKVYGAPLILSIDVTPLIKIPSIPAPKLPSIPDLGKGPRDQFNEVGGSVSRRIREAFSPKP